VDSSITAIHWSISFARLILPLRPILPFSSKPVFSLTIASSWTPFQTTKRRYYYTRTKPLISRKYFHHSPIIFVSKKKTLAKINFIHYSPPLTQEHFNSSQSTIYTSPCTISHLHIITPHHTSPKIASFLPISRPLSFILIQSCQSILNPSVMNC